MSEDIEVKTDPCPDLEGDMRDPGDMPADVEVDDE